MTTNGLTAVTAPVGTFVDYSISIENGAIIAYNAEYTMSENDINALCRAMYNAGVKYTYDDSTEKSIDEIFDDVTDEDGNPTDGYIYFHGYTSTQKLAQVYAVKQEDGTYNVEITI